MVDLFSGLLWRDAKKKAAKGFWSGSVDFKFGIVVDN